MISGIILPLTQESDAQGHSAWVADVTRRLGEGFDSNTLGQVASFMRHRRDVILGAVGIIGADTDAVRKELNDPVYNPFFEVGARNPQANAAVCDAFFRDEMARFPHDDRDPNTGKILTALRFCTCGLLDAVGLQHDPSDEQYLP